MERSNNNLPPDPSKYFVPKEDSDWSSSSSTDSDDSSSDSADSIRMDGNDVRIWCEIKRGITNGIIEGKWEEVMKSSTDTSGECVFLTIITVVGGIVGGVAGSFATPIGTAGGATAGVVVGFGVGLAIIKIKRMIQEHFFSRTMEYNHGGKK